MGASFNLFKNHCSLDSINFLLISVIYVNILDYLLLLLMFCLGGIIFVSMIYGLPT